MGKPAARISQKWIQQSRQQFRNFLDDTGFPDPVREGQRGPVFYYPEWLIMFIAVLSVKLKLKSYVQIHKMAMQFWDQIAAGLDLEPISERQLRDRLKKICHRPGKPAGFIFQLFPELEPAAGDQR